MFCERKQYSKSSSICFKVCGDCCGFRVPGYELQVSGFWWWYEFAGGLVVAGFWFSCSGYELRVGWWFVALTLVVCWFRVVGSGCWLLAALGLKG